MPLNKLSRDAQLKTQVGVVDAVSSLVALGGSWWLLSLVAPSVGLSDAHSGRLTLFVTGSVSTLVTVVSGRRMAAQVVAGLQFYSSALRGSTLAIAACAVVGYFLNLHGRALLVVMFALLPASRVALRWALRQRVRRAHRRLSDRLPVAVLVGVHGDLEVTLKLDTELGYQPVSTPNVHSPGEVADVVRALNASAVVLDRQVGSPAEFRELVWKVEELGCKVMVSTPLGLMAPNDVVVVPTASHDLMVLSTASLGTSGRFIKRVFDLLVAAVLIIVSFPILAIAMIALLLSHGGPILHRGTRIGVGGQLFVMYKLRTLNSMQEDSTSSARAVSDLSAPKQAPHGATRVGKILRRWSIDELPQLFQVVSGSMSLVGPRPRLPDEHSESAVLLRRLNVRPGLTGLWQISGRGDLSLDEAAELDVRYVDSWSLFHDIVILVRTIKTVLSGKGAR